MTSPGARVGDLRIERPIDGTLTRRIELVAGSYASESEGFALQAWCGERVIPLLPCRPAPEAAPGRRGFWAMLVVQDWLDHARDGALDVEFSWNRRPVGRARLGVSPEAIELAEAFPISRRRYPVAPTERAKDAPTLIFPGLGAVGGTSLGQLFRMESHRRGWSVPVHHEADHAETWARYDVPSAGALRWIDGHHCWNAGARLKRPHCRVTFLRDPVRRLSSAFRYNALVHPREFPFRTLRAFLESGYARRYSQAEGLLRLAGRAGGEALSDAALADAAWEELRRSYAFIGLTERFEESVFALAALAGLDSVGMWSTALSSPRPAPTGWDATDGVELLAKVLEADAELYERAQAQFDTQMGGWVSNATAPVAYKRDARAEPQLSNAHKTADCLQWKESLERTAAAVRSAHGETTSHGERVR